MTGRVFVSLGVLATLAGCQVNVPTPPVVPTESAAPVAPVASTPAAAPAPVAYDAPRITPEEFAKRQQAGESFVIVDVRGADAYKVSHIEGAVSHPWGTLQQADPGFPRDKYILLYCT